MKKGKTLYKVPNNGSRNEEHKENKEVTNLFHPPKYSVKNITNHVVYKALKGYN